MSQQFKYADEETDIAASNFHDCIEMLRLMGISKQKIIVAALGEIYGLSEELEEHKCAD